MFKDNTNLNVFQGTFKMKRNVFFLFFLNLFYSFQLKEKISNFHLVL